LRKEPTKHKTIVEIERENMTVKELKDIFGKLWAVEIQFATVIKDKYR
jgi:hypothetical protein